MAIGLGQSRPAPPRQRIGQNRPVGIGGNKPAAPRGGPAPSGGRAYVPPWETDPLAQGQFAQANQSYGNTLGYLGGNREGLEHQFGLSANGQYSNNNPYSLAAQLQRRHEAERRGAVNSAGLNLYSGSTVNHLRGADFRFGQNTSKMKEEFAQNMRDIQRQEQEAGEAKSQAENEAKEGAINRLAKEPNPVVPAPGGHNRRKRRR